MGLILLVAVFVAALAVRIGLKGHAPILRCKSGESPQEARLILLGTYRVYTWSLMAALGSVALRGIVGEHGPWWVGLLSIGFAILMLMVAHAIYWRLGYPSGRIVLMVGHLSGLFALGECFVLRGQVETVCRAGGRSAEA